MKFTTGQVIDLVSNDVERMERVPLALLFMVSPLIQLLVVTLLLLHYVGWQGLMGMIFLIFLVPYLAVLSSANAALRLRTAAASDKRISLMNEVVSVIRAIKTHAWEDEYRNRIKDARR